MNPLQSHIKAIRRICTCLRREDGFTMMVALGVLTVTALLTGAALLTVQGDARMTRRDLDAKRAYAAAQSGAQAYLYALNNNATNSNWWQTCANDQVGQTTVPGSTTGATYSYTPVPANGKASCLTSDPVGSLIDTTTGTLRMKFTGYAGTAQPVKRTIVASFQTVSPLQFLWYTVHETLDTSLVGGNAGCSTFYYQGAGPPSNCYIYWATGDAVNGPMYTQDQFLIQAGGSPTFGRTSKDSIASQVPTSGASDICAFSKCQSARILGTAEPDVARQVPLPSDNANLLPDATSHGKVYSGTTTLTVNGIYANGWNCPTATSCTQIVNLDLTTHPIIYATNASGCSTAYDPTNVTYVTTSGSPANRYYGPCGDIYISGTYSTPLTIAAGNDVILTGDLRTSEDANGNPTGTATLGLVANYYVRVYHTGTSGNPAVTIDGAILTLQHSFFVDNYTAGGLPQGTLKVHGAIAQFYRGAVGRLNSSGYLKSYWYDDRFAHSLPPYLFDLQTSAWNVFRQTLCADSTSTSDPKSCAYTGP